MGNAKCFSHKVDVAYKHGLQGDEGVYNADHLVQSVVDQDESSNAIRKLQGKKPIKTIVGKNTLPTQKSTYRKVLKFKGIQSSHCITYDRDTNKVSLEILLF